MELIPNAVVNMGIGMPESVGAVAAEEDLIELMTMTSEPGAIGGMPGGKLYFGSAVNPEALVDHPIMFDFYDGGGLDLAVLGMAENGSVWKTVNVSKFGPQDSGERGDFN